MPRSFASFLLAALAIAEAHARGLRVVAHVFYLDDAKALAKLSLAQGARTPVRAELSEQDEVVKEFRFEFSAENQTTLGDIAATTDVRAHGDDDADG